MVVGEVVAVVEVKLSHTGVAERELRDLYGPLVAFLWPRPQVLVEVCKYWGESGGRLVESLEEALSLASSPPPFVVWHWRG